MAAFNVTNSDDSGIGSLREAVELANANPGTDDIFIQTDVQLSSAIKITDSVNIGTPFGATIAQTEDSRIFEIDDGDTESKSEISLYRLNLTGGSAELGGAIISYENLSITDSSLYDNLAETNGAAVYVEGGDLTIERSRFDDNQIISTEKEDRAVYVSNGKLKVINSTLDRKEESSVEEAEPLSQEVVIEQPTEAAVNELIAEENYTEIAEQQSLKETESDGKFLVGNEVDDTLIGSAGDDTIIGGNGANSLTGMAGNDDLLGGSDRDFISGSDGDDTINGDAGDDNLSGNDGSDIINGGAGADILDGGAGDDNLNGGAESDFIQDDSGNNVIFGNEGSDRLIGGQDLDYLNGGAGDDYLYGDNGNDTLAGETGDDTLNGGAGDDTLLGAEGNDSIRGAGGNDILHGGEGNDVLLGSTEDDILHGDGGNDTLSGDEGDNFLTGGDGSDLFYLVVEGNGVVADFELGTDKLQLSQIAYSDLNITGDTNSILNYQDTQIGMVLGISPAELTQANFVE